VHSYMAFTPEENITASVDYGVAVPALATKGNIYGAQFHPEKSGETGLTILRNFGGLTK
jgi:glutamine amidotransferase